jgi:hypothetical protein
MKTRTARACMGAAVMAALTSALMPVAAQNVAALGPAIKRVANLPNGAPAFDVSNAAGRRTSRAEWIWNGWFDCDALANRLVASTTVMAAVLAKDGRMGLKDLEPAVFDCVLVRVEAAR